ncbi:DUF4097 family beta strand repeat-containing protein [Micromonospora sp. CPCC 206061]|uniref:DUF4097 family beta strand repeat-containing protein n=1 Tax=Micromonospora sp. CPCC 206061 TaxID=3122410 RepID=UPI002FEF76FE
MNVTEPSTFAFDGVRQVNAFVVSGSVRVVGTEERRAKVEVAEIAHGPMHVERHRNGLLDIRHRRRTWKQVVGGVLRPRRQPRVELSIAVPRDVPVNLWVVSAAVVVSGLRGSLEVHGGHGEISLADVSGFIDARTVSGAIEAVWNSGNVRIKSHSGDVTLAECAGHSVQVTTHSGGVTVDNRPPSRGDVSVTTHSGDVLLALPEPADVMVNVRSTSGRIESQFPEIEPMGPRGARAARGTLGTGASSIAATTVTGDVSLVRRGATVARTPS